MLHIKVKGSPEIRGKQIGETFKKNIHELAQIRRELVCSFLKPADILQIDALALLQVQALKKYPKSYQEFLAIAEAANISTVDLCILNNYTDMRDFTDSSYLHSSLKDGGCSVVYANNGKDLSWVGQTWDMHASAEPFMLYQEVEDEGLHLLTLTGCLALCGVNRFGVCVLINNMHCKETSVSIIWPALVREMLAQKTALEALEFLKKNIPCSGHNYLISDSTNTFNVETTGLRFDVTQENLNKKEISIFHTNHYVGPLVSEEILTRRSKTSLLRHESLQNYFQETPLSQLNNKKFTEELFVKEKIAGVCIPNKTSDPHASATCGGIYFDYLLGRGELFSGLYKDNKRIEFSLKGAQ